MPTNRLTLVRSTLVLAMLVGALGCIDRDHGSSSGPTNAQKKTRNEPMELLDLDGKPFDLWHDGSSQVTVVVFTRSDCPISNRYAPVIRELYESFHPRAVDFYLIYVDPGEQPDAIREHLREYGYPCPGLRDPSHSLVALAGATHTPEAVVFDRDRQIVYRGRIDDRYADFGNARAAPTRHDLAEAIEATLAGRAVSTPVTEAVGCPIADLDASSAASQ